MALRHLIALVLLVTGSAVLLLSACALLVLPAPYARLHALSPATSLGAPLIALALAVDTGPGRGAVKLLVIGALLAAGGPITTMAIGRASTADDPDRPSPGTPTAPSAPTAQTAQTAQAATTAPAEEADA
jgi:monovalent cation/proton antiporter MnhG/PhaG subunit